MPFISMSRSSSTSPVREVNIAIVGSRSVGKSAIVVRYLTRRFIGEYNSFKDQKYTNYAVIDGENVRQHIFDCRHQLGRTKFQKLLKWTHCVMIVFSVADLSSFYSASFYLQILDQKKNRHPCILVANKADLEHIRCVNYQLAIKTAVFRSCFYLEVSAAEGVHEIDTAFISLTKLSLQNRRNDSGSKIFYALRRLWKNGICSSIIKFTPACS